MYVTQNIAKEYLASAELEIVLDAYAPTSEGYYLNFPRRAQVQPKLRAFIETSAERNAALGLGQRCVSKLSSDDLFKLQRQVGGKDELSRTGAVFSAATR